MEGRTNITPPTPSVFNVCKGSIADFWSNNGHIIHLSMKCIKLQGMSSFQFMFRLALALCGGAGGLVFYWLDK